MLPYSQEVWFAVFGQYNSSVWPAIVFFYGLFALAFWQNLSLPVERLGGSFLPLVLASAWVWTGIGFYALAFSSYDFLAPFEAALWIVQALITLGVLWIDGGFDCRRAKGFERWAGFLALGFGLLLSPLLDLVAGVQTAQLRWFGVAPGPTLVVSLGVFLLARARWYLWLLPLLWSIKAGLVAWWLGVFQDLLVPLISVILAGVGIWSRRHRVASSPLGVN